MENLKQFLYSYRDFGSEPIRLKYNMLFETQSNINKIIRRKIRARWTTELSNGSKLIKIKLVPPDISVGRSRFPLQFLITDSCATVSHIHFPQNIVGYAFG